MNKEKFEQAIREALAKYGQNTWGAKHSCYVIAASVADETGANIDDLLNSDSYKVWMKVVNPSAFAQWLETNVKGFVRQKHQRGAGDTFAGFSL